MKCPRCHHAFRGEVWDKAVGYLHQAGRKATSRSAHQEAIAAFEQALVALQHFPESPGTIEQGIDLKYDLEFELFLLGHYTRGLDVLREADAAARALGDQRRLGSIGARIGDRLGSLGLQALTKFHLGLVSYSLGDYQRASTLFTENVTVLHGDLVRERFGLASAPAIVSRVWLARSLAELGDFAEAIRLGAEGLRVAESIESPWSTAQACLGIGGVLVTRGAFPKAIAPLERGLALCESREFYLLSSNMASHLAYAYAHSGRLSDSLPLLERAAELALLSEFRAGQPRVLVLARSTSWRAGTLRRPQAQRQMSGLRRWSRACR